MARSTARSSVRPAPFDLLGPLPRGRTVVEASAGTGKTYTISALITRYIAGETSGAGHDLGAGFGIDQILVVTFTRAAAAELRDRIRQKIQAAADFLEGGPLPASDPWMAVFDEGAHRLRHRRALRLRDALHRFDEAVITTIHGFCQQALAQAGLRAAGDPGAQLVENDHDVVAEVCRDLLVRELSDDPFRLSVDGKGRPVEWVDGRVKTAIGDRQPHPPEKVERDVIAAVRAVLTNAGATTIPVPSVGGVAGRWAAIVSEAVAAVARRQRQRRELGYDRLVTDLRDALVDPVVGPPLAEQLGTRFPIVLVDEFQDTDRVQWEIFEQAFADRRLITVGDPKQAIYRFRGADVHAYLDAVRAVDSASLGVNHRSDRRLLDGLAVLFNGVTLGHEQIAVSKVDAAPAAPRSAVAEPGRDRRLRASIHVHAVADTDAIAHTTRNQLESGAVQRVVLADVASRVRALLDGATVAVAGSGDGSPARPVRPADIAVLVPSQRRAADTAAVLREWGIATVRSRTGSVLDSEAAMQWRLLLAGLATPTRARVARAAGLSWFFDLDPASLADSDDATAGPVGPVGDVGDTPLAALQRRLATLAHRLRTDGLGAFYEQVRTESQLFDVVLGAPNGDRNLTDLDHVADLLVSELRGQTHEPLHVQQTLDRLIADAETEGPSEATMRRIETDDHAVHITTIHSAKGLEYPIVLMPFAYVERPNTQRPYVFNATGGFDGGRDGPAVRYVDVASWVSWVDGFDEGSKPGDEAAKARSAAAKADVDGDSLRTLYVAMTRACHRLEVWWAPTGRSATSPFGRLLLDREGAGPVQNSPVDSEYIKRGGDAARDQIDLLAAASNGTIAAFDVAVDQPIRRPLSMGGAERQELVIADDAGRHPLADPTWRSWSFTAVTAAAAGHERAAAIAAPVTGGTDEPADPADGGVPMPPGEPGGHGGVPAGPSVVGPLTVPLADVVGGTTFGTMVHEIFEQLDFTDSALPDEALRLAADGARGSGLALDPGAVAAGITAAVATPLGPLFDGGTLGEIGPADRLAELTFDLELPQLLPAARIGEVLTDTLDVADSLRPYGAELAAALEPVSVRGWLTGSIDAVFRVAGDRFVVVDYKTNRLHAPGTTDADEVLAPYRPDRLVAAMTHSHYPLQALLYSVALHRYLRWRLGPGYRPERHLGGIAYLFVRGMVGPDTPTLDGESHGVFSWRPPVATVTALDALLGGGVDE